MADDGAVGDDHVDGTGDGVTDRHVDDGRPKTGPAAYPYAECRIHHTWEFIVDPVGYPWPHWPEALRYSEQCAKCDKKCHRALTEYGTEAYVPVYQSPDDYHLAVDETPSKSGWRLTDLQSKYADWLEQRAARRTTQQSPTTGEKA